MAYHVDIHTALSSDLRLNLADLHGKRISLTAPVITLTRDEYREIPPAHVVRAAHRRTCE